MLVPYYCELSGEGWSFRTCYRSRTLSDLSDLCMLLSTACLFFGVREHRDKVTRQCLADLSSQCPSHQNNHWRVSLLRLHRRGCYLSTGFPLLRLYCCRLQRLTVPVVAALEQLPVTFLQLEHRRLLDNLMSTTNKVGLSSHLNATRSIDLC